MGWCLRTKNTTVGLGTHQRLEQRTVPKVEGSQNWWKNSKKLAKAHDRVACQRQDTLHKMTTYLARTYALIGLEDLNTRGMLANHHLAQSVSDASFFEVKRQVLYKAEQYGGYVQLVIAGMPAPKPPPLRVGQARFNARRSGMGMRAVRGGERA